VPVVGDERDVLFAVAVGGRVGGWLVVAFWGGPGGCVGWVLGGVGSIRAPAGGGRLDAAACSCLCAAAAFVAAACVHEMQRQKHRKLTAPARMILSRLTSPYKVGLPPSAGGRGRCRGASHAARQSRVKRN